MLESLVSRKTVNIDDIVIDYPKQYDTFQSFLTAEKQFVTANTPRIESTKSSILKKGFYSLGLDHIDKRDEYDRPYILYYEASDGTYRGISGRVGRTIALKFLRAEGQMSEVEIFVCEPTSYPGNFKLDFTNMDYGGFQKITLGDKDKTVIEGRDDIEKDYWHNFCINDYFWLDKSVLDVTCNIGAWSFMSLERGASEVVGFDQNSSAIHVANTIKNALSLPRLSFSVDRFEDYCWNRKFDVAFLNQCIYHFKLAEGEVFQRISNYADFLFMYTFISHKQEGDPNLGTYIPTIDKLKQHLIDAGFTNIFIVSSPSVIKDMKDGRKYGGKIYIISFKNNVEPRKMKYFGFDVLRLKQKGFAVGTSSRVPFTQWWYDHNQLEQYSV